MGLLSQAMHSGLSRRPQKPQNAATPKEGSMSIGREIEDIARDLVKHQHDHPPVRDLNREVERRLTLADRTSDGFSRLVGSWIFSLAQAGIMVLWVALNSINLIRPWDRYPFYFLN